MVDVSWALGTHGGGWGLNKGDRRHLIGSQSFDQSFDLL